MIKHISILLILSGLFLSSCSAISSKKNNVVTDHAKPNKVDSFDISYNNYIKRLQDGDEINITKLNKLLVNRSEIRTISQEYCQVVQNSVNEGLSFQKSIRFVIDETTKTFSFPAPPYIGLYLADVSMTSHCQEYLPKWREYQQNNQTKTRLTTPKAFRDSISLEFVKQLYLRYGQILQLSEEFNPMSKAQVINMATSSCSMIAKSGTKDFAKQALASMDQKGYSDKRKILQEFDIVISTGFVCPHRTEQLRAQFDLFNPKSGGVFPPSIGSDQLVNI